MKRSASIEQITGPAACAPNSATKSGTPMKPVLGNAATSAPNAASFRCTRLFRLKLTVKNTMSNADVKYTSRTDKFSKSRIGEPAPKRNRRQGSATYNTKVFRPGIALSGSTWKRAAR